MLRQDELAFIKALSTRQPSPALLKELRTAFASSKKKRKTVVSAGSRGTMLSGTPKASQHPSNLSAGKREANDLVSSGGSTQHANRRPVPGAGCAPLPAFTCHGRKSCLRQPATRATPRAGLRKRLHWTGPSPQVSQVGRSSPQPWIRTCPNPLSHTRQQ